MRGEPLFINRGRGSNCPRRIVRRDNDGCRQMVDQRWNDFLRLLNGEGQFGIGK